MTQPALKFFIYDTVRCNVKGVFIYLLEGGTALSLLLIIF